MMAPQETVFVIDDNELARKSLCALVESIGLDVEEYSSAEAFLAGFDVQRNGCVVTDLRLGGMDGLALQKELNKLGSHLPVVLVTGFADDAQAVAAKRAGAVRVLEKPCEHRELRDTILMALRGPQQARGFPDRV